MRAPLELILYPAKTGTLDDVMKEAAASVENFPEGKTRFVWVGSGTFKNRKDKTLISSKGSHVRSCEEFLPRERQGVCFLVKSKRLFDSDSQHKMES